MAFDCIDGEKHKGKNMGNQQNYGYEPEILRKLQLTELDMLIDFDRVCREQNISYVIDAGTALGAVRHKGFIPWDDDIDIRMRRDEYEKFCEIAESYLNPRYFLQTYKSDSGYRWGYARIIKKDSVFSRKDHEMLKSKSGIFIDIFPVDPYPQNVIDKKRTQRWSWIARKGLYSEVGRWKAKGLLNRLGFWILSIFPKKIFYHIFESLSKKYRDYCTPLCRCYAWSEPAEESGFLKEWINERVELEFEGHMFYAPKDYDGFLKHSFGDDYMTLPPEESRVIRHPATYIEFGE